MKSLAGIVKNEPVLVTSAIQAIVALVSGTAIHLSAAQSGGILAATTAVLTLVAAARTRPFHVTALTGFMSAVVTLLVAFGIHDVQPGVVSTLNGALVAITAIIVRLHVSPKVAVKVNGKLEEEPALVA